ncbi:hypothetical protein [Salibaculum griseiflavum]|uniref:Uncharacterized protein n=1 Tax=Salibaculum griseiflavum TaxID=1914409 RepID=A0A2V1P3B1_9RHOB|nr:hypothetical protein [Salibaculum griseiflavum]PWG15917.1 hypothetical protein DFK10_14125 [Salibaculum griseiflavum]
MRHPAVCAVLLLAACSQQANHLGNPLFWPVRGAASAMQEANYTQRRGEVELFVKTNHPDLLADIRAGGGPTLTRAFDLAEAPQQIRAPHILQLQSDLPLYEASPEALVVAIMVTG